MKKIRTAFIYKASNPYMSKKAWATTYYHFFFNALNRNENLEMCYFSGEEKFDVTSLRGKFDIILLWENHPWGSPDELTGIDNLDIPVICRVNDYHDAKIKGKLAYHEKYKIDHYFGYMPESYFYKYYPKNFRYKVIIYGVEKKLYENLTPFEKRIKNKILNSGAVGKTSIKSRIANRILRRTRDFAEVKADGKINKKTAIESLNNLGIDNFGLDEMDRLILNTLIERFDGGPVGVNSLSVAVSEDPTTIEDVYEPYLIKQGFIQRTSRGRIANERAFDLLGKKITDKQQRLFK